MSKIILTLLMTFSMITSAQIVVTEFNAEWNATNNVEWLEKLSDCDIAKVDIMKQVELQQKHKVVIVPTIIVFKDGEEIKRYQADLSFKMLATREDIQYSVVELSMSDF